MVKESGSRSPAGQVASPPVRSCRRPPASARSEKNSNLPRRHGVHGGILFINWFVFGAVSSLTFSLLFSMAQTSNLDDAKEFILLAYMGPRNEKSSAPLIIVKGKKTEFKFVAVPEQISNLFWIKQLPSPEGKTEIFELVLREREFNSVFELTKRFLGAYSDITLGKMAIRYFEDNYSLSPQEFGQPQFQLVLSTGDQVRHQAVRYPQMSFYLFEIQKLLKSAPVTKTFYLESLRTICESASQIFNEPNYFMIEKLSSMNEAGICLCFYENYSFEHIFKNNWDPYFKVDPWTLFWQPEHRDVHKGKMVRVPWTTNDILRSIQKEKVEERLFIERNMVPALQRKSLAKFPDILVLIIPTDIGLECYLIDAQELANRFDSILQKGENQNLRELVFWIKSR